MEDPESRDFGELRFLIQDKEELRSALQAQGLDKNVAEAISDWPNHSEEERRRHESNFGVGPGFCCTAWKICTAWNRKDDEVLAEDIEALFGFTLPNFRRPPSPSTEEAQ